MYVGASYKIMTKSLMFYIFANLAQLIKRMQSTRHTTAHRLNDDLGRQQILRERIFCKLSNTFEQFGPPFTACRGWPPLRTYRYQKRS